MNIFTDILQAPELTRFKEMQRWTVVQAMFQHSRFSFGDRIFRRSFYVAVSLAVLGGLIVGISHGGFWSALGMTVFLLFVTVIVFALVSQVMWVRRLRQFLGTEECQTLIRTWENDGYSQSSSAVERNSS